MKIMVVNAGSSSVKFQLFELFCPILHEVSGAVNDRSSTVSAK